MTKANNIFPELKKYPETKNNEEIGILKKVIEDLRQEKSAYQISPKNLKSYFLVCHKGYDELI